jgi:hypothetical protein
VANTPHKRTTLAPTYSPASSLAGSWPSPMVRPALANASRSQDTILDGRRVLASQHGGTAAEWLVDNQTLPSVTQVYPDATTWRVACRARTELAPGSALVCRVVAVKSGPSVYYGVVGSFTGWHNAGNGGAIKFEIDYRNTATQTASEQVQYGIPPSLLGQEDLAAGWAWTALEHRSIVGIRPGSESADLAKWSEWPTVEVTISHRAGARIVHATVSEQAWEHVAEHTVTDATTVNGAEQPLPAGVTLPLEEEPDGFLYEEHRHGTHRLLHVARRQTQRMGPRLAHWYAWDEASAAPTAEDAVAFQATTTTRRPSWGFADVNQTWNANAPGFAVPPTRRAPENLPSRVAGAASSPVRVRCYCRWTATGSATGYLRIQTTARSWVELVISQATIGTDWRWVSVTGWLETDVAPDDGFAVAQDFARTTANTLEIRGWDLTYCDFATGLP